MNQASFIDEQNHNHNVKIEPIYNGSVVLRLTQDDKFLGSLLIEPAVWEAIHSFVKVKSENRR